MAQRKKNNNNEMPSEPPFRAPLTRAIMFLGSARALARATMPTLSHTTIRNFSKLTDRPPRPAHAIALETATGGYVDRMEFYPEVLQGPLGKRVAAVLREYAQHDPAVAELVVDMERRGVVL